MNNLKKSLCAAAAAFSMAAGGIASANAATLQIPAVSVSDPAAQQIRHVRDDRLRGRGGSVYYRGHRGHRHKRRGHRYHKGYWFPAAAFIGGVIIGKAFNQHSRPIYRHDDRYRLHDRWCDDRYRSYRVSDDTFQPYHGPRRKCNSPNFRYY